MENVHEQDETLPLASSCFVFSCRIEQFALVPYWFKVMLYETIRDNTAFQHCCDIVSNGYNIVPTLQRCVASVTSPLG